MKNYPLIDIDGASQNTELCVVALGVFDGVHRGHLKLLSDAKALAKKLGAKLFALTFHPHPAKVLRNDENAAKLIYPVDIRAKLLYEAGADKVFVKNFTTQFASQTPENFLEELKSKFVGLKAVVTGENFRFGKNATGNVEWLKEHSKDYGIIALSVDGVKEGDELVSSTRLRKALELGDVETFFTLAGRDYIAEGNIVGGKHLGRELGFPTLNLPWSQECSPKFGVYISVLINLETGLGYAGVSNYGISPTVGETEPLIETNLFDNVDFGVGSAVRVAFLKFLRAEEKFDSVEKLKAQILKDKLQAQKYFEDCKNLD